MFLRSLQIQHFKNHNDAAFSFSDKIICIAGNNGAGKTNLLDAVYYLCLTKSYFNSIDYQNVRHGENFFTVKGSIKKETSETEILCRYKDRKKTFLKNKAKYQKLADHIGNFPCVIIAPVDLTLITGGSEERRRFIDSIISQYDRDYLDALMLYNRLLSQRNALLKKFAETGVPDFNLLETLDTQMNGPGTLIYNKRSAFNKIFIPKFQELYTLISGDAEQVNCFYNSDLKEQSFGDILSQNRQKDLIVQRTIAGIHKDDHDFFIGEHPIKKFGSQGQQKSYIFALKLAQYILLKEKTGTKPLLLLDDLFDRLDMHRMQNLVKLLLSNDYGQIFISDTQGDRVEKLFSKFDTVIQTIFLKDVSRSHEEKKQ